MLEQTTSLFLAAAMQIMRGNVCVNVTLPLGLNNHEVTKQ